MKQFISLSNQIHTSSTRTNQPNRTKNKRTKQKTPPFLILLLHHVSRLFLNNLAGRHFPEQPICLTGLMEELLTWGRGNKYVCQIPTGEIVYLQLNSNGFFPSPDSPEPPFPGSDLKEPPATEGGKSREIVQGCHFASVIHASVSPTPNV